MASILSGYEYDIFISYRQKDNKGNHWVTEFVNALKTELESAFKEDISIYFDSNPSDGLLETHNVDKSLEGKLKCLIFIPILSQTYCDPKSFAWQHEFCAFNKWTREGESAPLSSSPSRSALAEQGGEGPGVRLFGRDIKLKSGNVASRILPIQIHELEEADKALVENELGSVLRAVEFIYQAAGVVRPLLPNEEDPKGNLKHTFYRDQVNKVVRGIKELIIAMQAPAAPHQAKKVTHQENVPVSLRKKISITAASLMVIGLASFSLFYFGGWGKKMDLTADKSIAVLPFENMNKDPEQDYFSDGIAEDILNHLVKISDLKVKSRTSTLQYKETTKTAPVIGSELGVGNIVEGSVRRVGNKVRIVVQLIDTETDTHLWSETYDRDFKDVLALQSEIAIEIAKALRARLTNSERQNIEKQTTQNASAYDYFLKAREYRRRGNFSRSEIESALSLVNQSISMDRKFSEAHALKASLWYDLSTFGLKQAVWYDSATQSANEAITMDPSSPDGHLIKSRMYRYLGDMEKSDNELELAFNLAPQNPQVQMNYGFALLRMGKEEGADMILKANEHQYSQKDPEYYSILSNAYFYSGNHKMLVQMHMEAKKLNPGGVGAYHQLAFAYTNTNQLDKALEELKEAEKINPDLAFTIDLMAWTYFRMKDYTNAAKYWGKYPEIESTFADSTQILPFRHRLAMTYDQLGKKKEGYKLVMEDLKFRKGLQEKISSLGAWDNFGSVYYDLAVDHAYLRNDALAVQCLDSALHYQFYFYQGYGRDPIFDELRKREDFKKVVKKTDDWYEFRRGAFSNALNRAKASEELKGIQK